MKPKDRVQVNDTGPEDMLGEMGTIERPLSIIVEDCYEIQAVRGGAVVVAIPPLEGKRCSWTCPLKVCTWGSINLEDTCKVGLGMNHPETGHLQPSPKCPRHPGEK